MEWVSFCVPWVKGATRELNVGDVDGGVGAVFISVPGANADAALTREKARVGGGLSERAATGEQEHGAEGRALDTGGAVVKGDGHPPGALQTVMRCGLVWLGVRRGVMQVGGEERECGEGGEVWLLMRASMGRSPLGKVGCNCMDKVAPAGMRSLED